jgi:hypothetical protein
MGKVEPSGWNALVFGSLGQIQRSLFPFLDLSRNCGDYMKRCIDTGFDKEWQFRDSGQ